VVAGDVKAVPTAGPTGMQKVAAGSEKITETFEPAGEKLMAKHSFKTGVGVRVAATVTLADKPDSKLNFRLKQFVRINWDRAPEV
jgi:hypothetical protein